MLLMFLIYDFVVTRSSSSTSVRHVFLGAGLGTTAQEELAAEQDKAPQPGGQAPPRRTSPRKVALPKNRNMLRNGGQRAARKKNGTRQAGRRTRATTS